MTEMLYTEAWTEGRVIAEVHKFSNSDYTWSKIHEERNCLDKRRKAAVLVPLFVKHGDLYVWLTLRSKHLRDHPGDVAFPGGKRDNNEDEVETCLRESYEEIGLPPSDVRIVAPIPPRLGRGNILVSPIIGLVNPYFTPKINETEVDLAFSLPMRRFLSKDGYRTMDYMHDGTVINIYFFDDHINDQLVTTWGITGTLCAEIAIGLFGRNPEYVVNTDKMVAGKFNPKDPFAYQVEYLEEYKRREQNSKL